MSFNQMKVDFNQKRDQRKRKFSSEMFLDPWHDVFFFSFVQEERWKNLLFVVLFELEKKKKEKQKN